MNPITLFQKWFNEELNLNSVKLPAACCLSTCGLDDYPNARFVSLKEISKDGFVITGSLSSRKGEEVNKLPKAALTFWWTSTERQVRIQGNVVEISRAQAELYFDKRNKDSKIVSTVFEQGRTIDSIENVHEHFKKQKNNFESENINLPRGWGGIYIKPVRIEFMEFKESRLHERTLYQFINNDWEVSILQP